MIKLEYICRWKQRSSLGAVTSNLSLATRHFDVVGTFCLVVSILLGCAHIGTCGDVERAEIYRRGYSRVYSVADLVTDYNSAHRSDAVARQYPELDAKEIESAVAKELSLTHASDSRKRERLTKLAEALSKGEMPKGTLIAFQYSGKNRAVFWYKWPQTEHDFCIVLWSGLDENPPGEGEFNDDAYIIALAVRRGVRTDTQYRIRDK